MFRASISNLLGKITAVFVICSFCLPAQAKYGGGTGEPNDPYLIFTAEQMNAVGMNSTDWDKDFKLMADIDLSTFTGTSFNIIGKYDHKFTGVFDGNSHTISNFTYTSTGTNYIGFFGYVEGGQIKNLGLIDPNVDAGTNNWGIGSLVGYLRSGNVNNCYAEGGSICGKRGVGGLLGVNWGGVMTDCHATCSVSEDYPYDPGDGPPPPPSIGIGGMVGWNGGTITDCYSEGDVYMGTYVGGLCGGNGGKISNSYATGSVGGDKFSAGGIVGVNHSGTIIYCYAIGSVVSDGNSVGGLVGWNSYGTITNCYSEGDVLGNYSVGGLVGTNGWCFLSGRCYSGMLSYCYSTGSVSGDGYVGGLVGYSNEGTISNSFWDIETSGQITSDGGTGLSTEEMQMKVTFTDAGWDFENIWWILEGKNYPRLCWEVKYGGGTGEPNDPYLIYTAEQMNAIGIDSNDWDKHFKLMADIDLSDFTGSEFNIIGCWELRGEQIPFTGIFDGNGHTISNFSYNSEDTSHVGLFSYVFDANAKIKDLGLIAPDVEAGTGGYVGALVGRLSRGTITNCFVEGGIVTGRVDVGGLVGSSWGNITNCCSTSSVAGNTQVGGLVGAKYSGTITNCYSTGNISASNKYSNVGGLVGINCAIMTNCYSIGNVHGNEKVGGLVGDNIYGTITNCYSAGSVSGSIRVGGLVGDNQGLISNCYSSGTVSGNSCVGGLIGIHRMREVTNCYSMGSVTGNDDVGGLVGYRDNGSYSKCFWDNTVNSGLSGIGNTTDPNVIGESTTNMQIEKTFTDAGWDFTTPVWTIDDGKYYPRLWWEFVPLLYAEPEVTLGTSNTISWGPVYIAVEYYAECAEDANFTSIIYNSGWITETSYEFTGLELGKRYWYSVKARNAEGVESQWSNVESSLQGTLIDAVDIMLDPNSLKNENMKNALLNKVEEALEMIDEGLYKDALNKLENDILQKTNGCAEIDEPDKNDWIISCEAQSEIYPLVIETIEYVKGLMDQSAE